MGKRPPSFLRRGSAAVIAPQLKFGFPKPPLAWGARRASRHAEQQAGRGRGATRSHSAAPGHQQRDQERVRQAVTNGNAKTGAATAVTN
eukprot:8747483-Heterocapsa_arctica.AAC.1